MSAAKNELFGTCEDIANELKASIGPATGYGIGKPHDQVTEHVFGMRVLEESRRFGDAAKVAAAVIIDFATGYSQQDMLDVIEESMADGVNFDEAVIDTAAIAWERDF